MDEELRRIGIAELRRHYAAGLLSPVEFVTETLEHIEATDPGLNAFVTVDGEQALSAAANLQRRLGKPGPETFARYPLLGVPVSVKDLTPTKGLRTTRGSLLFRDRVPDEDAPAVARLRKAGAVIVGKTNTSEFGWSAATVNRVAGTTRNPWRPDLSPGGSSGGSAVAVATGMGVAATGTDGAGSIRIPAAFCGVVGFKPSFGRVPYAPVSPENLSHFGPMTRSVEDAKLLFDVLAGPDPADPLSLPLELREPASGPLRIGWLDGLGEPSGGQEILDVAKAAIARMAGAGHHVEPLDVSFDDPYPALVTILAAAEAGAHTEAMERARDRLDAGRLAVVEHGKTLTAVELMAAITTRAELWQRIRGWFEGFDVLAMPTVVVPPFAAGLHQPESLVDKGPLSWLGWAPTAYTFNLTGQPALSVPVGTAAGLPVGVQLVGGWRADEVVLRAGAELEQVNREERREPWHSTAMRA